MKRNKKNRKNRPAERIHVFKHAKPEVAARNPEIKTEGTAEKEDAGLTFIRKDLRMFLILSSAILILVLVFFIITERFNIEIFNIVL